MYQITIRRTTTTRKVLPKSWERVDTDDDGKPVMGYTPEVETLVTDTRDVYSQVVDELDLVSVIDAINKPMTCSSLD